MEGLNTDILNTKILIVDDLQSLRRVLKRLLMQLGFREILEASDGEEARVILESTPVNFVISDWEMPTLNGYELLKWVRAEERLKAIPFIMITSVNNKDMVVQAAEAGVSDYIAKPFSKEIVAAKIIKALTPPEPNLTNSSK